MTSRITNIVLRLPTASNAAVAAQLVQQQDIRYCLFELLSQAALWAYLDLGNSTIASSVKNAYYETNASFLQLHQTRLRKEAEAIMSREPTVRSDMDLPFLQVSSDIVFTGLTDILAMAKSLLGDGAPLNMDNLKVFDYFTYGEAGPFFKAVAQYRNAAFRKSFSNVGCDVTSEPFVFPAITRNGYDVEALFYNDTDTQYVFSCSTNNTFKNDIFDFLSYSKPLHNTATMDQYLYIAGSLAMSTNPPSSAQIYPKLLVIASLKLMMHSPNGVLDRIADMVVGNPLKLDRNNMIESSRPLSVLMNFIASTYDRQQVPMGPLTAHLLDSIATGHRNGKRLRRLAIMLQGKKLSVHSTEDLSEYPLLDPTSEYFEPPTAINFAFEALSDDFEAGEGDDPPEPEKDTPPKESGDGDVPDNDDEPPPKEVVVKVPKHSILFQIADDEKDAKRTFMYLVEVNNLISFILGSEDMELDSEKIALLRTLRSEWLNFLDVKSIQSFLKVVLNISLEPF